MVRWIRVGLECRARSHEMTVDRPASAARMETAPVCLNENRWHQRGLCRLMNVVRVVRRHQRHRIEATNGSLASPTVRLLRALAFQSTIRPPTVQEYFYLPSKFLHGIKLVDLFFFRGCKGYRASWGWQLICEGRGR